MDRQSPRQEPRFVSGAEDGAAPPVYAPEGLAEGIPILAVEPIFAEILQRAGQPRFRRRRNRAKGALSCGSRFWSVVLTWA